MGMLNNPDARALLKAQLTDSQAEKLQERLNNSGLNVAYQEEQHGPMLMASIRCSFFDEPAVHKILRELGITLSSEPTA